jgi:hypothetical protein
MKRVLRVPYLRPQIIGITVVKVRHRQTSARFSLMTSKRSPILACVANCRNPQPHRPIHPPIRPTQKYVTVTVSPGAAPEWLSPLSYIPMRVPSMRPDY